jgi:hypothetical protein
LIRTPFNSTPIFDIQSFKTHPTAQPARRLRSVIPGFTTDNRLKKQNMHNLCERTPFHHPRASKRQR